MKKVILFICKGLIYFLKPIKLFAYRTKSSFLRRIILQFTAFIDFVLSFIYGQNEVMEIHKEIYKGNFIFGHGVMKTDYDSIVEEIQKPSMRTNRFMGIPVVSSNEAFIANSPLISLGEPFRTLARNHINETIYNEIFYSLTYSDVKEKCSIILNEWLEDKDPKNITVMRSVVTRTTIYILQEIDISKNVSESVTTAYLKRFIQLSLFKNYFPIITGLIGVEKKIKKDAFYPLIKLGVSPEVVDSTLFAAMFSIGTLFTKCVDYMREHKINYQGLSLTEKLNFVKEVVRLYPTVTTTHRILESPEKVKVAGQMLQLTEGDEIVYPFISANKDKKVFECPHKIKVDRSKETYDKILSWSKGAHACPARNFSVILTTVMLDALNHKVPLDTIDYKGAIL